MAEPVDPATDFRRTRGRSVRSVNYQAYDPAADDHGTAEAGYGVRGPARVGEEGGRVVTRRTWTLTGLAGRPVLRSLIVDGSDSWVVETATPDPAAETVWVCETVLNG